MEAAATPQPTQRLPAQARLLFLSRSLGWAVPLVFLAFVAASALAEGDAPGWTATTLRMAAIALAVAGMLAEAQLRWRNWRYELRDEEIDLRRGALVITRTLIPTIRVQHVDTQRTWLSDQLGLRSVVIHTAGGAHRIPALPPDEAAAIRDRIAQLARRPDDV
jgi:membrane protein YdbS with pleckstrin-like domain